MRITKNTWKVVEDIGFANPVTVSAPKSHVRPKSDTNNADENFDGSFSV